MAASNISNTWLACYCFLKIKFSNKRPAKMISELKITTIKTKIFEGTIIKSWKFGMRERERERESRLNLSLNYLWDRASTDLRRVIYTTWIYICFTLEKKREILSGKCLKNFWPPKFGVALFASEPVNHIWLNENKINSI